MLMMQKITAQAYERGGVLVKERSDCVIAGRSMCCGMCK
jgi:hypothetical protein